jgi:hypothetical protein
MRDVMRVELPDGQLIWAIVESDRVADTGSHRGDRRILNNLTETIHGVATNVRAALDDVQPHSVTIEFGVELATADTGLVAALVGLNANASVKVTLEWRNDVGES